MILLAIGAVLVTLVVAGCGGTGLDATSAIPADTATGSAAAPEQLASVAPAQSSLQAQSAAVNVAAVPTLSLAIATTLNGTGTVKAASLTKAELLSTAGVLRSTATVTAGVACFPVSTLTVGHYFIRVNGLVNDLVPTKLDSITVSTTQFVGTTLRNSVIGTLAAPKYKIATYSLGQNKKGVVGFLTGLTGTPVRYGYALQYIAANKLETRVLKTAALLASVGLGSEHNNKTWLLGASNHGKSTSSCTGCHGSKTTKPATYAAIGPSKGWCYKCHYGSAGVVNGLLDPKL
ncbi:MAG: hypothetical protein WCP21_00315 [Armatimonadota bacterium]